MWRLLRGDTPRNNPHIKPANIQSNRFIHRYKISRLGHTIWMKFRHLTIQLTFIYPFCYSQYAPNSGKDMLWKNKTKKKRMFTNDTSENFLVHQPGVGLGGSVGCAVRLETRRSRVQPPPRSATFFRGDWSWNIFNGHSLPSADSRRAVVSFWRKNVHNTV